MKKKILITISILLIIIPFFINDFSIIRMVSLLLGIIILVAIKINETKNNLFMLIYLPVLLLTITYSVDYMMACIYNVTPIYAIENKSSESVSVYNSLMYRVYNCNGNNVFDNHYTKDFMCKTSLLNSIDINKVLNEPKSFYDTHKKDFIKITGKISKINGNSSIELRSYIVDENNILNGYVIFDQTKKLNILISNKIDVSHYKIYDYITVVGELANYEDQTLILNGIVLENNNVYNNYSLSVIEPTECEGIKEYTEGYYTYCLSNIFVDYKIDKYELSYALKDKKITFDNLKKDYIELKEQDDMDLYHLDKFNILVCNEKKTILLNKNYDKPFDLCDK